LTTDARTLGSPLETQTKPLAWRRLAFSRRSRLDAAFVIGWEAQSQLATLAYLALVAFGSLWLALPVMLTWAMLATAVYFVMRRRGYPDILEHSLPEAGATSSHRVRCVAASCVKVWCAGLQASLYTRVTRQVLAPSDSGWRRLARPGLLLLGLTMFGVSTAHHLLGRAGFQGKRLLRMAVAAAFLNVVYRTLLSAAVTHAAWSLFETLHSTAQA
jgi:hypothetical protein